MPTGKQSLQVHEEIEGLMMDAARKYAAACIFGPSEFEVCLAVIKKYGVGAYLDMVLGPSDHRQRMNEGGYALSS